MNLFERLKYNHRYSALDSSDKVKAELYLFNKYTFTRRDVPNTTIAAYDIQQNWYNALSVKPSDKTDIDVEHKKWVLEHFDDVVKLHRFQNAYNAASTYYNRLRIKYSEEIQILCIRHLININSPSYSDLLILTNEKKLEKIRIDEKYTKLVLQDERRAAYIDKYIKDTGYQPSYIIENLDKLEKYIDNCIRIERKAKYEELKKKYPDGMAAYEEGHRYNLSVIIEHAEEIKKLDAVEKRFKRFMAQHGTVVKNYIEYLKMKGKTISHEQIMKDKKQFSSFSEYYQYYQFSESRGDFPSQCYYYSSKQDSKFEAWGRYKYFVFYSRYFDFNNETVSGDIQVWQFFNMSFCQEQDLDYGSAITKLENNNKIPDFLCKKLHFKDYVYEAIYDFVDSLFKSNETVLVVFGDSGVTNSKELNKYHFNYLELLLDFEDYPYCQIADLKQYLSQHQEEYKGKNIKIIVVELVTYYDKLDLTATRIITSFADSFVNITFVSLLKEYNRDEMVAIIEDNKKKERKKKEEEEKQRIAANNAILDSYGIKYLYHMTSISNLRNILTNGLLNYYEVRSKGQIKKDISMQEVQDIRHRKRETIHGRIIHEYVPMYFNPKNPMLYVRRELQSTIVILKLDRELIFREDSVFTDGNAANAPTKFFNNLNDLSQLDWDCLDDDYWTDHEDGKRKRCAEVLAYSSIPVSAIKGIACMNMAVKDYVMQNIVTDNDIPVLIDSSLFFPY